MAKVDPKVYDAYVGRYEIGPETIVTFTREGDRLMAQPDDEGKIEVFPESETVFFLKPSTDATVTFVKDDKGKVTHIVLHRDGTRYQGETARRRAKTEAGKDSTASGPLKPQIQRSSLCSSLV